MWWEGIIDLFYCFAVGMLGVCYSYLCYNYFVCYSLASLISFVQPSSVQLCAAWTA